MANDIFGGELNVQIPNDLFRNIKEMEDHLNSLSAVADNTGAAISKMFRNISSQGADKVIQDLYDTKVAMESISKVNPRNNSFLRDLKNEAVSSLDSVNKLIDALTKMYGVKTPTKTTVQTRGESQKELDDLRKVISLYRDRIEATKQLSELTKKELSGKTLSADEHSQISQIQQRIQTTESEIATIRQRGDVSKTVLEELAKQETKYTLIVAEESRRQAEIRSNANAKIAKQESESRRKNYENYVTSYDGAMRTSQKAHTYEQEAQAIRNLEQARASLSKKDADYATKLNALNEAINRHKESLKQATLTDEQRAKISEENSRKAIEQARREQELYNRRKKNIQDKWYSSNPDRALNFSSSTKSINDQIKAIQYLKQARDQLTVSQAGGEEAYKKKVEEVNKAIAEQQKKVDQLRGKHEQLEKRKHSLINTTEQLKRKLALLFSVSAIQGYVNKLVQVRGEFELQQRSLQVLLQDKDEANKLWDQTVKLAVKSPFTVKELVTYTKQLAAYRIESDKLYETNKMLADISAGLGVDMNRLILAFGQVKAASFLRGTELRQFSEAGIPMLDALADKFSEVEGRVVSVGEVFERVSKRMVTFKDVEEVLKGMTSVGGTFYQMQEKQSDTLAGMMSNLRDRYDLMLNDIGKDQEGLIKGSIKVIMTLLDKWRMIAPAIEVALYYYIAFLSQKGIAKILRGLQALGVQLGVIKTAANTADVALSKMGKTNVILLLISLIVSLGYAIYEAADAADEFNHEFNAIDREVLKDEREAISTFIELANTLKKTREGTEEFNEAMEGLKRTFKDILPDEMLRIENIRKMGQGYKEAADAIRLYYTIEASERKKAKANELFDKSIEEDYDDIVENLSMRLDSFVSGGLYISDGLGVYHYEKMPQEMADAIRAGYINALNMAIDSAKNGEIAATGESLKEAFYKNLSDFSGFSTSEIEYWLENTEEAFKEPQYALREDLEDIAEEVATFRKKTGDIDLQARPGETREIQKQRLEYEKQAKVLGELESKYSDLKAKIQEYYDLLSKERKGENVDPNTKVGLEKSIAELYKDLKVEIPLKPSFVMEEGDHYDFSTLFPNQRAVTDEINRVGTTIHTVFYNQINPAVKEASTNFGMLNNNTQALGQSVPSILETANYLSGMADSTTTLGEVDLTKPFSIFPQLGGDIDNASTATSQLGEKVTETLNSFNLSPLQEFTRGVVDEVATATGLNLALFDDLEIQAGEGLDSFHQKVQSAMETATQDYLLGKSIIENNPINSTIVTNFVVSKGFHNVEDFRAHLEQQRKLILNAYPAILKKSGWFDKSKSGGRKNRNRNRNTSQKTDDPAEALRDLMDEMYDVFQDFNEEVGAEAANLKIQDIYFKKFNELAKKVKGFTLPFPTFEQGDDTEFQKYMDELYKKAKKETKDRIDEDKRNAAREDYIEEAKEFNEVTKETVESLFEEYEAFKELEELGVSPELAKSLFGISTKSLKDIRTKLEDFKRLGWFEGTNMEDAYQEFLDRITKMEIDEQQELLKKYIEYAKTSVSERGKIMLDYYTRVAEIEKATVGRGTDADKDGYLMSVYVNSMAKARKDAMDAMKKFEWEEFQKSDMFVMMFENLDSASESLMRHTLKQLEDFKEQWKDMPLEDVKAMTDKINELKISLLKLGNPFKVVKDIRAEISATLGKKSKEEIENEALAAQTAITNNNRIIDMLGTISTIKSTSEELLPEHIELLKEVGLEQNATVESINAEISKRKQANVELYKSIEILLKLLGLEDALKDAIKERGELYGKAKNQIDELYNATKDLLTLFADEDSIGLMFSDMGISIADAVLSTLELQENLKAAGVGLKGFQAALNTAMGVIGWIQMGVQVISSVLNTIFNAHDKAKQKEIDKEVEKVETLEKSLEKLEERLEEVYSMGQLKNTMNQAQQNIEQQIASYERMIKLEKEKKDTDKDQIKEWQETIEELREKREEMHKEMVESLGGDYDIRGVARDFVDAWIDAFKETGDGLKGLQDEFKDFFLNILLEQAVMDKAGDLIGNVIKHINDNILYDGKVTERERQEVESMMDNAMNLTDDYLTMLFGDNGVLKNYISDTESSLSGLQQGIQGVTEETAQVIEAYLNSIRLYIAQDNQNLAKLTEVFTSVDAPNPILSELRNQTELITTIKNALNSVIKTGGHTEGGAYIKVAL